MRFKVDENLPLEIGARLVDAGHDATTVTEQDLVGEPDDRLAEVCKRERRALVTLDLDFADIRTYPPREHAGIIVLRVGRQDKSYVLAVFELVLPYLDREPLTRQLWIVDESGVRMRSGNEGPEEA